MDNIVTLKPKVSIRANRKKVWNIMMDSSTYKIWTKPFSSREIWYEGEWKKGEKINFLTTNDKDEVVGMITEIQDIKEYEYVVARHLGLVKGKDLKPEYFPDSGTSTFEKYFLRESADGELTDLEVEHDTLLIYKDHLEPAWPKALELLKELCEKK